MVIEIYNFFVFFLIGFVITLVLTFGFGQLNLLGFDYEKFSAYECGFDPFEDTRFSFDIRFYLVAIFFIIFDLEVIFFFRLLLICRFCLWLTSEFFRFLFFFSLPELFTNFGTVSLIGLKGPNVNVIEPTFSG